jgi:hypothetical protein
MNADKVIKRRMDQVRRWIALGKVPAMDDARIEAMVRCARSQTWAIRSAFEPKQATMPEVRNA